MRNEEFFQARMDTAFKKTRLAARWEWLYLHEGYTKVQTRLVTAKQTKPRTCEASSNHEVPCFIYAEPSRAFIKNKAVDFRAKKKICDNQNIFDIKNLCKSVIICGQKNSVDKGMLNN